MGRREGDTVTDPQYLDQTTANVGGGSLGRHRSANISAGRQLRTLLSCVRLCSFHCNHYYSIKLILQYNGGDLTLLSNSDYNEMNKGERRRVMF